MISRSIYTRIKSIVLDKIIANPVLISFIILLVLIGIVCGLSFSNDYYQDFSFVQNIIVEAHGMLLDVFVVGCLLLWLTRIGEKRFEIKRWKEVIDDFRSWESDEATHRIVGIIKRLNKEKISKIDLSSCHLKGARLERCNLFNANLSEANLEEAKFEDAFMNESHMYLANLWKADFTGAYLHKADLSCSGPQHAVFDHAVLTEANLQKAVLFNSQFWQANLQDATLQEADLTECNFQEANLQRANFEGSNLQGACLAETDLTEANLRNANLSAADLERSNVTIEQLSVVKTLYKAVLPVEVQEKITKAWPQLLLKPSIEDEEETDDE